LRGQESRVQKIIPQHSSWSGGTKGLSAGKKENKLGMRASETTEVIFDNVRIPKESLMGGVGDGFMQAMKVLDGGRISIAALSLGIAQGAYEAALKVFERASAVRSTHR
jgi:alkylation response protein AidB-like acyl-CoA dehydrogenase